jgi:hypothetical protein
MPRPLCSSRRSAEFPSTSSTSCLKLSSCVHSVYFRWILDHAYFTWVQSNINSTYLAKKSIAWSQALLPLGDASIKVNGADAELKGTLQRLVMNRYMEVLDMACKAPSQTM